MQSQLQYRGRCRVRPVIVEITRRFFVGKEVQYECKTPNLRKKTEKIYIQLNNGRKSDI